jgi:hypothetical protein
MMVTRHTFVITSRVGITIRCNYVTSPHGGDGPLHQIDLSLRGAAEFGKMLGTNVAIMWCTGLGLVRKRGFHQSCGAKNEMSKLDFKSLCKLYQGKKEN